MTKHAAPLVATVGVIPWLLTVAIVDGVRNWLLPVTLAWLLLAGLLAVRLRRQGGVDWLVPTLFRVAEYVGILRLAAISGRDALPAAFALVAVLALHEYDAVYRPLDRRRDVRLVGVLAGGWGGRLVFALVGAAALVTRPAYYAAAGALAVLFVTGATVAWSSKEPS